MNSDIRDELLHLGNALLIAFLIWAYYRRRTYASAERYSTFWPRFLTAIVDSCVLWPVDFITTGLSSADLPRTLVALLVTVGSLASFLYTVVMHARYGQTVGKMVTKVRVVDFRTGGSISWGQAWLREGIPMVLSLGLLAWEVLHLPGGSQNPSALADGKSPAFGGVFWLLVAVPGLWDVAELLTMLTNEKRRALHDFIAGTIVVRTNTEVRAQPDAGSNGGPAVPSESSAAEAASPSASGSLGRSRTKTRTAIGVGAIWAAAVLAQFAWSFLSIFCVPIQAERYSSAGRQLPWITQQTIDLMHPSSIPANLLIGWAALATSALVYQKDRMSEERYRRRMAIVLSVYFLPIVAATLALLLPAAF